MPWWSLAGKENERGLRFEAAGWRRREKEEERVGADENERVGALSMAGERACGGWLGRECGNDGREVRRDCGCPHEGGGCNPSKMKENLGQGF